MTPPVDLDELQALLKVITPLPYWIEPAQSTLLHGYHRTLDAYIAFGTQGDLSDTFDLIERYEVDTDYAYLVAAANAVPALLAELTSLRSRLAEAEAAVEQSEHYKATLEQIAKRDDTEMAVVRTLHYDMRGWARAALAKRGGDSD